MVGKINRNIEQYGPFSCSNGLCLDFSSIKGLGVFSGEVVVGDRTAHVKLRYSNSKLERYLIKMATEREDYEGGEEALELLADVFDNKYHYCIDTDKITNNSKCDCFEV